MKVLSPAACAAFRRSALPPVGETQCAIFSLNGEREATVAGTPFLKKGTEMIYEWKVIEGALCLAWSGETGRPAGFQRARLDAIPDSNPNAAELIGLEIDNGPMGTLFRNWSGGKDARQLGLRALPSERGLLPAAITAFCPVYYPDLEVRVEQRSLESFLTEWRQHFAPVVTSARFLRHYSKPDYQGPWGIIEPDPSRMPRTIEFVVSTERTYRHEGIPFLSDRSDLLLGIREQSAQELEKALVAASHAPQFSVELDDYRGRAAGLLLRMREVRASLNSVMSAVGTATADTDRFSELLRWLESSGTNGCPCFLLEPLSDLKKACAKGSRELPEFRTIPQDVVQLVRRFAARRVYESR